MRTGSAIPGGAPPRFPVAPLKPGAEALALRAFTPYWASEPHADLPVARRPAHRSYDLVIVGAGVSGALLAEALADGRRSVLVVDRRMPMAGSTSASTALVQHEIDVPLHVLKEAIGPEKAERIWHRSATAVERLLSLVAHLGINCGAERKKTLYLAGNQLDADGLAVEAQARNLTGLRTQYVSRDCLHDQYGLDRPAALLSTISASLNPVQLAAGLLRESCRRGTELVGPLEVIDVRPSGGRIHLLTSEGDFLSAGQVVFSTGYEFPESLAHAEHRIASTWAIASAPGMNLPRWAESHLIWEASDPYLYIRTTPDGRVLAGGEDEDDPHAFNSVEKHGIKSRTILEKVSALLDVDLGTPEFCWSGAFGKTATGLPYIGAIPHMPKVYAVMGFGGNGMTFSQIAADILKAELNGGRDVDAELFALPDMPPGRLQA